MKNKTINSLLVGIFVAYWLFFVIMVIFNPNFFDHDSNSTILNQFFPRDYHMVSNIPKETIITHYDFYQDGQLLSTLNIDSLYHLKLQESFPYASHKKNVKNYAMVYGVSNIELGNDLYRYAFDTILQSEISLQNYIMNDKTNRIKLNNQLNHAHIIKNEIPILSKSDSVDMKIIRKLIKIDQDSYAYKYFGYWIQDTLLIQMGKKL